MIRVIEGTPGAGKTNIVCEWLLKDIDKGTYDECYTSINNLRVVGVKSIPPQFDWRDLNPVNELTGLRDDKKRLVIYDEAQYEEAFMKENRKDNPVGKDLSTHRHYGIDLWLISQSSALLNSYVHANTGEHVFMYRPRKKKTVKVYWWSHIQKSLTKDAFKTADDEQTWRLNPSMFPLYTSTSGVTDGQTRKSTKLFSILFSAVLIFSFLGFMVNRGIGAFTSMSGKGDDDDKVLTVSPKVISGAVNGVSDDKQSVSVDRSVSTVSDNVNDIRSASGQSSSIYNPVTGAYYTSGDIAVSGAVMVDGECWAYNVKAQRVLLSNSECSKYLASAGNMAKVANPSQNVAVKSQPLQAVIPAPTQQQATVAPVVAPVL